MTPRRLIFGPAIVVFAVMSASGCATPSPSAASPDAPVGHALGSLWPGAPEGEVIGQGTVMDIAGSAELCLGGVMESWPPQCNGMPLKSWSWEGVEGWDSQGETRWGTYAVQGTFDGAELTVTQPPIMLALYDPMAADDPTGGRPGTASEAELSDMQERVAEVLGEAYLGSYPENGRLVVEVLWDDGTWQDAADADFGPDKLLIRSALQPLD